MNIGMWLRISILIGIVTALSIPIGVHSFMLSARVLVTIAETPNVIILLLIAVPALAIGLASVVSFFVPMIATYFVARRAASHLSAQSGLWESDSGVLPILMFCSINILVFVAFCFAMSVYMGSVEFCEPAYIKIVVVLYGLACAIYAEAQIRKQVRGNT